jgi:hypothetical protein
MNNLDWSDHSKTNCWIWEIAWFFFAWGPFWQSTRSQKENGLIKDRLYER